mmetsp:Transcript_35072/g.81947  ORF Transcript_35072/g.81947 Transcript_35072/m.81947 type:complete len:245 (-) Transcript_35072:1886-2620(-)
MGVRQDHPISKGVRVLVVRPLVLQPRHAHALLPLDLCRTLLREAARWFEGGVRAKTVEAVAGRVDEDVLERRHIVRGPEKIPVDFDCVEPHHEPEVQQAHAPEQDASLADVVGVLRVPCEVGQEPVVFGLHRIRRLTRGPWLKEATCEEAVHPPIVVKKPGTRQLPKQLLETGHFHLLQTLLGHKSIQESAQKPLQCILVHNLLLLLLLPTRTPLLGRLRVGVGLGGTPYSRGLCRLAEVSQVP